ncbi:hypothetical protein, partial [Lactobacillus delbrueckii]|uniref:hypothetical protein n=1 Tax=Lactobacillus delbrueckii TaxID=1584 RepID=UPI0021A32B76
GSCVFVVINIVRDNPSFFVAYFLFTQEFILNHNFSKKPPAAPPVCFKLYPNLSKFLAKKPKDKQKLLL